MYRLLDVMAIISKLKTTPSLLHYIQGKMVTQNNFYL